MLSKLLTLTLCIAALGMFSGCLGSFASNQARRQAARTADHYVREYVEPEINDYYANDPNASAEFRQARNDLADTIVRTGNEERQPGRVGVGDDGWLTKEERW